MHHSDTRCWYVCSILILWLWIVHSMYVIHHSDTRCWCVCSILILWLCVVHCMQVYIIQFLDVNISLLYLLHDSKLYVCLKQTAWNEYLRNRKFILWQWQSIFIYEKDMSKNKITKIYQISTKIWKRCLYISLIFLYLHSLNCMNFETQVTKSC